MKLTTRPGSTLHGTVRLAGDKSLSHRAALFAGLANGESQIDNFLDSGVTRPLLAALRQVGVAWELNGQSLTVNGRGIDAWQSPVEPVWCGNSATTLRLLAGAHSAAGVAGILDGTAGLRRRPMKRILEPLQAMGVDVLGDDEGKAPLILKGRPQGSSLKGTSHTLQIASAQVKSCILLAGLSADGPTVVVEPGPSRDHTERMLRSMGVAVEQECHMMDNEGEEAPVYWTRLFPPRPFNLSPLHLTLPGDISSAAFLLVAALITPGSKVTVENVVLNPTRTGLLDVLQSMGANITIEPRGESAGESVGDVTAQTSALTAVRVEGDTVVRMIDEFPIFAIAAAYAAGDTLVCNAEELRTKESDRIGSLCAEIRAIGGQAEETGDGFRIHGSGKPLAGGEVDSHGDHRLAMSLAVAGLASRNPVTVLGGEAFQESFPEFLTILRGLGGDLLDGA